jgi:hypothetical protein
MRLPTASARHIALGYYVNRFPSSNAIHAVRNPATARRVSKWVRTWLRSNEKEADQYLTVMNKSTIPTSDVSTTAIKALETLSTFADNGPVK